MGPTVRDLYSFSKTVAENPSGRNGFGGGRRRESPYGKSMHLMGKSWRRMARVCQQPRSGIGVIWQDYGRLAPATERGRPSGSLTRKFTSEHPAMLNKLAKNGGRCACPTRSRMSRRLPAMETAPVVRLKRMNRSVDLAEVPPRRSLQVNRSCHKKLCTTAVLRRQPWQAGS